MADELRIGLSELLRKAMIEQDAGFLKEGVRVLSQALMEMEVEEHVGAGRHERSAGRTGQRNGYRERDWDTRVGTVELRVPQGERLELLPLAVGAAKAGRAGAICGGPGSLRPRHLHAQGGRPGQGSRDGRASPRARSAGCARSSTRRSSASESRPLEGPYPYVWVDATYVKARQDGRVVSVAVVIAVGVNGKTGEREVLGVDVGPSEDGAFWTSFLRSLVARGLRGVKLVTSDAHRGLKGAIEAVLQGASWQRCRVHFMRNALSLVPKAAQQMVGATIRTVFAQPDAGSASRAVAQGLGGLPLPFPETLGADGRGRGGRALAYAASQRSTGRRSGPTTRLRGSTRRSRGGRTWWGSSRTRQR